jgi:enediyne biosynthesis protein E5
MRRFLRTPKGALALVFLPLLAFGAIADGWLAVLPHVITAVAGATLVELIVARLQRRAMGWPSSAILSGAIVAFVLDPVTPHVATFLTGGLATLGKYLLATRRGHVFNPAALALLISIPLFATGQSWWGALPDLPWPFIGVLVIGGAFVVDRINKFPLVLAFMATYFTIFTLTSIVDPTAVAEMFRTPFVQSAVFLAIFMLTDPPTSPSRERDQVMLGALVGVTTCVAQLAGFGQAYLLIGVLLGNVALAGLRYARTARAELVPATLRRQG